MSTLYAAAPEMPTLAIRSECSDLVDLARRMNIGPDDAIRQFIDFNQRHAGERSRRS